MSDQSEKREQVLTVHRIYTKSSLFESAAMTLALLKNPPAPIIDMQTQVNYQAREDEKDLYEAVLHIQLTAKLSGNLLWRQQIQVAGLYTVRGFEEEQIKHIINGHCMNQLYPYACAALSTATTQAGFPAIYLTPLNFDALYREQLKKEDKQAREQATEKAAKTLDAMPH